MKINLGVELCNKFSKEPKIGNEKRKKMGYALEHTSLKLLTRMDNCKMKDFFHNGTLDRDMCHLLFFQGGPTLATFFVYFCLLPIEKF